MSHREELAAGAKVRPSLGSRLSGFAHQSVSDFDHMDEQY